MKRACLAVAATALMLPGLAQAAGQSLPDTIALVRDKLAAEGSLSYVTAVHDSADNADWSNQMVVGASNLSPDAANCLLGYHWRTIVDGKPVYDADTGLPFSTVGYVDVTSMQEDTQHNVAGEHPTWTIRVTPPIWVVSVVGKDGAQQNALDFRDHDTAEAVAQAVRHGADLCKG